jgi:GNAT superfamily N-acetyltransferase
MILRKATSSDIPIIWEILQEAIEQRRLDGSNQWQDGYPNEGTIADDLQNGFGYVLLDGAIVIAYAAIIFGVEPAYNEIEGEWLSIQDYVVVHRVATAKTYKGKGIATKLFQMIEEMALSRQIYSIKVDTNFDNIPMMKILDKLAYSYCGEVYYRGAPRRAYEKVLAP